MDKYPYVAKQQTCNYTTSMKVFEINECAMVKPNSTKALQSALIQQPVAVIVDSTSLGFQLYKRGVFNGNCATKGNHAMLLIGYGAID